MSTRRTAVPRQFSTHKKAKTRAIMIIGTLTLLALLSPVAVLIARSATVTANAALAFTGEEPQPAHRAFAEVAAARWAWGGSGGFAAAGQTTAAELIGRPGLDERTMDLLLLDDDDVDAENRVPLGISDIIWSDAYFVTTEEGQIEHHRFLVVTEGGLLRLTVPVAPVPRENATDTAVVAGMFSIAPWIDSPETTTVPTPRWADVSDSVEVGNNILARVNEWADAYAASDSTALLALTGDPDNSTYPGIGGFQVRSVEILDAAFRNSDDLLVVAVRIAMIADTGVALDLSYDLLVDGHDRPFPNIVAWHSQGLGPVLEPYGNAIDPNAVQYAGLPVQASNELDPRQFARRAREVLENLAAIERAYARDIGGGLYATFGTLETTSFSNAFGEANAPLAGTRAQVEGRVYENGVGFCVEAVLGGDSFHATHVSGVVPGRCPLTLQEADEAAAGGAATAQTGATSPDDPAEDPATPDPTPEPTADADDTPPQDTQ
ncbi:hypothetical protein DVS28_b0580 (plasmid) [Euzebya pacifica]|uniref:Uncharacterized protein n=1 Tax=Euzebya pacifica TaxID=1608957 RepID=A0A346Y773_9ACTN|nr:hypothetical protein [Euzebya pacifica]AXV10320.1 hypothetical protein DVS28_b0580 [Euzebya pacifica]